MWKGVLFDVSNVVSEQGSPFSSTVYGIICDYAWRWLIAQVLLTSCTIVAAHLFAVNSCDNSITVRDIMNYYFLFSWSLKCLGAKAVLLFLIHSHLKHNAMFWGGPCSWLTAVRHCNDCPPHQCCSAVFIYCLKCNTTQASVILLCRCQKFLHYACGNDIVSTSRWQHGGSMLSASKRHCCSHILLYWRSMQGFCSSRSV